MELVMSKSLLKAPDTPGEVELATVYRNGFKEGPEGLSQACTQRFFRQDTFMGSVSEAALPPSPPSSSLPPLCC